MFSFHIPRSSTDRHMTFLDCRLSASPNYKSGIPAHLTETLTNTSLCFFFFFFLCLTHEYLLVPFVLANNDSFIYSKNGRTAPAGVVFDFWIKVRRLGQIVSQQEPQSQSLVATTTDIPKRSRNCFQGIRLQISLDYSWT